MEADMAGGTSRGRRNLNSVVRSHYEKIEDAIKTGDMSRVKSANRSGYNNEKREIREYDR
jgi:hypothetical protein